MHTKNIMYATVCGLTLSFSAASCVGRIAEPPPPKDSDDGFVFFGQPTTAITFLSTQLNPVEEAGKMRNAILSDFPGKVAFTPNDNSYIFSQIDSILEADPAETILLGALHGDFVKLFEDGALRPMDGVLQELDRKRFPEALITLSRLDGEHAYYIPWMQASFIMVANKKALPYLPAGAELDTLTYDQLLRWGESIFAMTGKRALGFPAGEKGLMHRFFQGYLYPAFTGSTLLRFRGPDAVAMWSYFKRLWNFVHPGSLVYSTMSEPLLTEDVLIAWDHTARLVKAMEEKPDEFVAFPAPLGPRGRGFMPVVSGLSIPRGVVDAKSAATLIDYLTQPAIQARALRETGFFPVSTAESREGLPDHLVRIGAAVEKQIASPDSIAALLPIGLGDSAGDYNRMFMLTFSTIVLEGKSIRETLDANAIELQRIIDGEDARCWLPDVSAERPCRIE